MSLLLLAKKLKKAPNSSKQRQVYIGACSPSVADRGYAITTPSRDPKTSREQRLWHLDCDRRELCSRRSLLSSVPCALNQVSLLLLAKILKKTPNSSSGRYGSPFTRPRSTHSSALHLKKQHQKPPHSTTQAAPSFSKQAAPFGLVPTTR